MVGAEPWKDVLLSYGTRLYEEYGRHESLQSCVRKHREAGHPSPEELGALEWLLLHHTPEVVEREGKDPLDVLLTTVYLGCCDVEGFMRAVGRCLKGDPAVRRRLQEASKEFDCDRCLVSRHLQVYCMCAYKGCLCMLGVHGMYAQACIFSVIANCDTSTQGDISHAPLTCLTL